MAKPVRIYGATPNGGAYSEAFYLDDNQNLVEPEKATRIMINECAEDGSILSTTYASANEED